MKRLASVLWLSGREYKDFHLCGRLHRDKESSHSVGPSLPQIVELRGIEPLSESQFTMASPITVIILTFPLPTA